MFQSSYVKNGVERKNLQSILPVEWNDKDFDYDKNNKDKGFGYVIKTSAINNRDTMESYEELCRIYPKLHLHYQVETRPSY